jgi:hypothetical protein
LAASDGKRERDVLGIDGRLNPFEQFRPRISVRRRSIERGGPLNALETSDSLEDARKRLRGVGAPEEQGRRLDSPGRLRAWQSSHAPTRVVRIDEPTMGSGESDDRLSRARQSLPKRRRRNA